MKGLILTAAMHIFEMDSVDDSPAEHIIPPDTCKDERKQLLYSVCNHVTSNFVKFRYVEDNADVEEDSVTEYAKQLLSVGLFYFEYRDAVKEGDGGRVLRCWKYLLPLFFNSRRDSKEALLLLCQHKYLLPPRQVGLLIQKDRKERILSVTYTWNI